MLQASLNIKTSVVSFNCTILINEILINYLLSTPVSYYLMVKDNSNNVNYIVILNSIHRIA